MDTEADIARDSWIDGLDYDDATIDRILRLDSAGYSIDTDEGQATRVIKRVRVARRDYATIRAGSRYVEVTEKVVRLDGRGQRHYRSRQAL